jgi:IS30 family transposase
MGMGRAAERTENVGSAMIQSFGRKLKLTLHQRREAIARREAGEALVEIGRSYNVSHSTISRLARHKGYIEGASAASFENSSGE